jgi:hypothetical protein
VTCDFPLVVSMGCEPCLHLERASRGVLATCGESRKRPLTCSFGSGLPRVATRCFSSSCGIFAGSDAGETGQPPSADDEPGRAFIPLSIELRYATRAALIRAPPTPPIRRVGEPG